MKVLRLRILVGLLVGLVLTPWAGPADVVITVGDGTGNPGESITVSVTFEGAPEPPVISAFSVFLEFDDRLLEIGGNGEPSNPTASKGADQSNALLLLRINQEADPDRNGKLELSAFTLSAPDMSNGENARLTFAIPADLPQGYYELKVTTTEVRDNQNAELPSSAVSGVLTVGTPPTPTPSPSPTETPEPTPVPAGEGWYLW